MALFGFRKNTNRNDNSTVVNTTAESRGTVINPATGDNRTVVNSEVSDVTEINIGTKLLGKYTITQVLNDESGEAVLFLCEYSGQKYVAKVYRRASAIKHEVIDKLLALKAPNIARTVDFGTINEYPVEILPYYEKGSLAGKRFSADELRKQIIPQMNEALKALHSIEIIHKDIKPSNIMVTQDGRIVLIDFGISSVRDGATVIATVTGMTPDYTAPEALKGLFLNESDYYSMGISLYELFVGATPYAHMSPDEIERMITVQKLPLPADMPKDLQELITALTYHDITNRKDKQNPNRRWTYDEVKAWCEGKKQPIPGSTAGRAIDDFEPITFKNKEYTSIEELIDAFTANWEDAKRFFFDGDLSHDIKRNDPGLARKLRTLEDEADDDPKLDKDVQFFKMLYILDKDLRKIIWKGRVWESLTALGRDYAKKLAAGDSSINSVMDELLSKKLLSTYLEAIGDTDKQRHDTLAAFESRKVALSGKGREEQLYAWTLAYTLSGEKVLRIKGKEFREPKDITAYMLELVNNSRKAFDDFCAILLPDGETLDLQFESWLNALGYTKEIEQWRESLLFE